MLIELRYLLLLSIVVLCQCNNTEEDEFVNIPDPNFLLELIGNGVDTDGDGHISFTEAEAVTVLNLGPANISDLSGIEAFIRLDSLSVLVNPLPSPDFSENVSLRHLSLRGCGLAHLDLSKNTLLVSLDCSGDLGMDNFLSTLDVSGNSGLEILLCPGNELEALDLSTNPALKKLNCSRNRIRDLDLSSNLMLREFKGTNNLWEHLDLSANTELEVMTSCGNRLSSIDLSLNTKLQLIGIDNMPYIREVCVWTTPFPPPGVKVLMDYSPNAYFTTSCSTY